MPTSVLRQCESTGEAALPMDTLVAKEDRRGMIIGIYTPKSNVHFYCFFFLNYFLFPTRECIVLMGTWGVTNNQLNLSNSMWVPSTGGKIIPQYKILAMPLIGGISQPMSVISERATNSVPHCDGISLSNKWCNLHNNVGVCLNMFFFCSIHFTACTYCTNIEDWPRSWVLTSWWEKKIQGLFNNLI